MKIIACLTMIAFILPGCTTLRPIELSQSTIQERIFSGDLLHPGDRVEITTNDGKHFEFKIMSVTDGYIKGKDIEIPIKDISLVEKRETSIGKTVALVGAFLLIVLTAIAGKSAGAGLGPGRID
jgi:hypothetical protein